MSWRIQRTNGFVRETGSALCKIDKLQMSLVEDVPTVCDDVIRQFQLWLGPKKRHTT